MSKENKYNEEIGFFDVVRSLVCKQYDPFIRNDNKCCFFNCFTGGISVFLLFVVISFIIAGIFCSCFKITDTIFGKLYSSGIDLIGILTSANFVVVSIVFTVSIFKYDDNKADQKTIYSDGVKYVMFQLVLAFVSFIILPVCNWPLCCRIFIFIFSIIFSSLITVHILFHIYAVFLYSIGHE